MSKPSDPVETTWISLPTSLSPRRMMEPLPNCFSIWLSAAASALLLLSSIFVSPFKNSMGRIVAQQFGVVQNVRSLCDSGCFYSVIQYVKHTMQGDLHRLIAHCGTVARQMMQARMNLAVAHSPSDPYRADRFFRRAAGRPGDAAYRQRDVGVAVRQSS